MPAAWFDCRLYNPVLFKDAKKVPVRFKAEPKQKPVLAYMNFLLLPPLVQIRDSFNI